MFRQKADTRTRAHAGMQVLDRLEARICKAGLLLRAAARAPLLGVRAEGEVGRKACMRLRWVRETTNVRACVA